MLVDLWLYFDVGKCKLTNELHYYIPPLWRKCRTQTTEDLHESKTTGSKTRMSLDSLLGVECIILPAAALLKWASSSLWDEKGDAPMSSVQHSHQLWKNKSFSRCLREVGFVISCFGFLLLLTFNSPFKLLILGFLYVLRSNILISNVSHVGKAVQSDLIWYLYLQSFQQALLSPTISVKLLATYSTKLIKDRGSCCHFWNLICWK